MFDGNNWSAFSIWIDNHVSVFMAPLGAFIIIGYVMLWYVAMENFIRSGMNYYRKRYAYKRHWTKDELKRIYDSSKTLQ